MPGLEELRAQTLAEIGQSGSPLERLRAQTMAELQGQPAAPPTTDRMWSGPAAPVTMADSMAEAQSQGGVLNYAGAIAKHIPVFPGIVAGDVGTGMEAARNDVVALGSRVLGNEDLARQMERQTEVSEGQADTINSGIMANAGRGATRSLATVALTGGGAPALVAGASVRGSQAAREADDAGLTGFDKAGYILRSVGIEALPELIAQRFGLGGVEKAVSDAIRGATTSGAKGAAKEAVKQTVAGELPGELVTTAGDIANQKASGVDNTPLTLDQAGAAFRDTVLQTLLGSGAAFTPSVVQGALNDRVQAQAQDQNLARLALQGLEPRGNNQMILDPTTGETFRPAMVTRPQDAPLAVTPDVINTAQQAPDLLRLFGIRGVADETALNQQREAQLRQRAAEDQAKMDAEAQRARQARALGDEAASIATDRATGMESMRKADDEALRRMELSDLIDRALGPPGPPQRTEVVGRAPDAPTPNEERDRYDAGRAAADRIEAEYQDELKAINARRSAPKGEKIGKDQAVMLRRQALERRNQRMEEAIQRAVAGEKTTPAVEPAPTEAAVPPQTKEIPNVEKDQGQRQTEALLNQEPAPKVNTPAPGPNEQDQAAAIAELERIASEVAQRTGKVGEFTSLLPHLSSVGYRVDRSQGLPEGADRKRIALEAAAKARGVSIADLAKAAQERAISTRKQSPPTQPKLASEQSDWLPLENSKGIPRSEMPQIRSEHRGALSNYLRARGIEWKREEAVDPNTLKPTQAEFSRSKVRQAKKYTGEPRAILVSRDGHILDGHHQWLAAKQAGKSLPIIRLDAPIERLMDEVKGFPSAESATGSEAATPDRKPNSELDVAPEDIVPFAKERKPGDDTAQGGRINLPGEEFTNSDLIRQQRKAEGERTPVSGERGWEKLKEESDRKDQDRSQANQQGALFQIGRLPPAPMSGTAPKGPVKKLSAIIGDFADWLGASHYQSRKLPRNFAGYYDPASGAMVLKRGNDLDVFAHEVGHWLDDRFGLVADGMGGTVDLYDHELKAFWPFGSSPSATHPDPESYRRAEGVAEWLRAWAFNPTAAVNAAPLFYSRFTAAVPNEVRARLREFGDDVRRFHFAPAIEAGAANIKDLSDTGPTLSQQLAEAWTKRGQQDRAGNPLRFGMADAARVRFLDRLHPLSKAIAWAGRETGRTAKADRAEMLVRLMAGVNDKTGAIARVGMIKADWLKSIPAGQASVIGGPGKGTTFTPKGAKLEQVIQRADGVEGGIEWLAAPLDTSSQESIKRDLRALDSYMVAQRTAEQADKIDSERAQVLMQMADKLKEGYWDGMDALTKAASKLRKDTERGDRHYNRVADRTGDADERNRTQSDRTDEDLARVQRETGDGRTGTERRADRQTSATRERLAKRTDALSKAIVEIADAVDRGNAGRMADTERKINAAVKALENRYNSKMAQLSRLAQKMERRDALRKARLSGQGGGTRPDDVQARRILADVDADPVLRARLDEAAKRYRAWADGVLRYLVDKGRMSEEVYQAIKADNAYYVAMNRDMDEIEATTRPIGGGKLGTAREVIKSFKGSQRTIENPLASLMEKTAKAVEESDRNEAVRSVVDLLREARGMHDGGKDAVDLGSVAVRLENPTDGAVKVFRKGEVEYWKFAPEIQEAIKGLSEQYRLPPLATFLPALARAGVVNSPPFAIRNRIRDIVSRLIISRTNPRTPMEWGKRLVEQVPGGRKLTGTEITDEQKAITELAGGAFAGHYLRSREDWQKETRKRVMELRKDKNVVVSGLVGAGRAYKNLIQSSEFSGRADEFQNTFRRLKDEGMDDMSAALMAAQASRQLVDFGVSGTWLGVANQVVPFLNAGVQGLRATLAAAKRDPAGFSARWALFSALPAMACYALAASGGEDELDEYTNLPAWRRDLFWNIKVAPNTWLSIPKPFELGVLGTGAERAVEAAHRVAKGEDVTEATSRAFAGYAGSVARSMMPVNLQDLVVAYGPIVEAFIFNKSAFTGKEIVPRWEVDKPVDQRSGAEFASRLGQVGTWLSGGSLDPRQVDHLVRGVFGQLGGLAVEASDLWPRDDGKGGDIKRFAGKVTGLGGGVSPDQQVDVAKFIEEEGAAGRAEGKAARALGDMRRAYWKATGGKERDTLAQAMRDYATGRDPIMAFDRAVTESNRLLSAWRNLEGPARASFAKENRDVLATANRINATNRAVAAAKKAGKSHDEVVAIIKRTAPTDLQMLTVVTKDAKAQGKQ